MANQKISEFGGGIGLNGTEELPLVQASVNIKKTVDDLRDFILGDADALVYKGAIDCSANPNYPAADAGHVYKVSVAGKIGGGSGPNVEAGDILTCSVDSSASGNHATVGANWVITQRNLDGAVTGPASSTSGNVPTFNGTGGNVLQDSGKAFSTDGTLASNSDANVPTEKAVKTYVDAAVGGGGGSGTVTSVDATGGVQTASGSAITGSGTIRGAHVVNAQTGTSYALIATDRGKRVTLSNAASIAATIAQAGTTGFEDGWFSFVECIGAGAVTITPTTSTINGAATLVLTSGMSAVLFSDGTNYRAFVLDPAGVSVNAQTGTSYTYLSGDRGKLVTHSNGSAIAGTLPQATGAFGAGWFMWVENRGSGALTITPTTSTIDGAASLALNQNQGCLVASDGTNYYTMRGIGGSGGSLTNWTEAVNSSSPNATVPVVSFTATNAASSADAVLAAKGSLGATIAQVPDSTTTGGNKRGGQATDFQKRRSTAAQVASGDWSGILCGENNTASGTHASVVGGQLNQATQQDAFVGGGASNVASGQRSAVPGGNANTASANNSFAMGDGNTASNTNAFAVGSSNTANGASSAAFGSGSSTRQMIASMAQGSAGTAGNRQRRTVVLVKDTSNATPDVLTSDASAASVLNIVTLPNNSLYGFRGQVAVRENATGDSKVIEFKGCIKRGANAASTALMGSVTQADLGTPDAGAASWTVGFSADTTNGGLAITVTGEASHTLKWVANIETTEVVG